MTSDGQPIVWRTTNAGATWTSIGLASSGMNFGLDFARPSIGHTSNNEVFCAATLRVNDVNFNYPRLWRGTSGTLPLVYGGVLPEGNVTLFSAVAGLGGDIVFAEFNYDPPGGWKVYVLPSGSSTPTVTQNLSGQSVQITRLDRFGRNTAWFASGSGSNRRSFSYSGGAVVVWEPFGGYERRIAGVTTAYLAPDIHVVHVINPADGAIISSAAVATEALVSDAQTRSVAAGKDALSTTLRFSEDQGVTWTPLAPPSGVSAIAIAVIVRE
jgi:hypothetical protein